MQAAYQSTGHNPQLIFELLTSNSGEDIKRAWVEGVGGWL